VEKFFCFELSDVRIRIGVEQAKKRGLENRITFFRQDFFNSDWVNDKFDLVFWDNSLHHMPDAFAAVKISKEILKEDGVFFGNEYIGESRFQWSDEKLEYVNNLRDKLDESIFHVGNEVFPRHRKRPALEKMIQEDPSEAADSANILPAVWKNFQNPQIVMLGGTVHMLLLDKMIRNIPDNSELMNSLIKADDEAIHQGMSLYAFILAKKNDEKIAD
uniref:class I SAM-dependent methyltransferase n=1 Tax=Holdemanella sp. TaxID=1971762 RepID=UPI003AEF3F4E